MASRVFLHIGAPKTGTTFLQAMLFDHAPRLRGEGILVPGSSRVDHARAATGARQGPGGKKYDCWKKLLEEVEGWPQTVVISNEWFSLATVRQAERAVRDLGDAETHVIVTARDLVEHVPSAWQETLKLGYSSTLESFVDSLSTRDDRWRWSTLDPALVLERWRGSLPVTQMHVVTLPPSGADRGTLWKRFAGVIGATADDYDTQGTFQRDSLGVEAARLLEHAGPQLRQAVDAETDWHQAYRWIQAYLSHEVLRPIQGERIALGDTHAAAVRERSAASVRALEAAGYDVAGDLSDLMSACVPPKGRNPDEVSDSELLEVAVPVIAELLRRVRAERLRIERLQSERSSDDEDG